MNWLPVDKVLPAFGVKVLVTDGDEIGFGIFEATQNRRGWLCRTDLAADYDGVWQFYNSITHWMYLPELPE